MIVFYILFYGVFLIGIAFGVFLIKALTPESILKRSEKESRISDLSETVLTEDLNTDIDENDVGVVKYKNIGQIEAERDTSKKEEEKEMTNFLSKLFSYANSNK